MGSVVERQFRSIIKFFENEERQTSIKKRDKKKYKRFIRVHSTSYKTYCYFLENNLIKTPMIGEGAEKVIFELEGDPTKVLKIYKTPGSYNREKRNYRFLKNLDLDNIIPCMDFNDQQNYAIVDRALPVDVTKYRVPTVLNDILPKERTYKHFGIIDDRIVAIDLGTVFDDIVLENLDKLKQINRS